MRSMKQRVVLCCAMWCIFTGFAALSGAADPVVRFQMGVACPLDSPYVRMAETFASRMSGLTSGRIAIEVVVLSQPNAERDLYTRVTRGRIDMACLEPWGLGAQLPRLALLGQPFMFASPQHARMFYEGEGGMRIGEIMSAEGVAILGWIESVPAVIAAARPLGDAESFRKMHIGVTDAAPERQRAFSAAYEKLGASTTVVANAVLGAAALARGGVDGLRTTPAELLAAADRLPADVRQATLVGDEYPFFAVCIAESSLAGLTGDIKEQFLGALQLAAIEGGGAVATLNDEARSRLSEMGFVFGEADMAALAAAVGDSSGGSVSGTDRALQEAVVEVRKPLLIQ